MLGGGEAKPAVERPTVEELEAGQRVTESEDGREWTDGEYTCFAQAWFDSPVSDQGLRSVAFPDEDIKVSDKDRAWMNEEWNGYVAEACRGNVWGFDQTRTGSGIETVEIPLSFTLDPGAFLTFEMTGDVVSGGEFSIRALDDDGKVVATWFERSPLLDESIDGTYLFGYAGEEVTAIRVSVEGEPVDWSIKLGWAPETKELKRGATGTGPDVFLVERLDGKYTITPTGDTSDTQLFGFEFLALAGDGGSLANSLFETAKGPQEFTIGPAAFALVITGKGSWEIN